MNIENQEPVLHENLHKDLKLVLDKATNDAINKTHSSLLGVADHCRAEKTIDHFDHPDHLDHHELVHDNHHEFVENLLNKLIDELEPDDHLRVYEFIKTLHDRSKSIHNDHYIDHQDSHPEKTNAKNFHGVVDNALTLVKEKILLDLDLPADHEINETDFYNLLIENERDSIFNVLSDKFDNFDKDQDLEDHHHEEINNYHNSKTNIHGFIDDFVTKWELQEKVENNITYMRANKDDLERFDNLLDLSMKNAITTTGKMFKGVDKWAIFGSTAVTTQSENPPESVDDIDITFDASSFDKIKMNLDELKKQGLIYEDKEGKQKGYNKANINLFGENVKIQGFIDSGVPDPKKPGKNILIEFEAFGENKDSGITQLGYLDTNIIKFDKDGQNIQMLEKESLIDHYIVVVLSELFNENLEKDKDIMRLKKLEDFGIDMFTGLQKAIQKTYERYPNTQDKKLKSVLEKSQQCIDMLETARKEYQGYCKEFKNETEDFSGKNKEVIPIFSSFKEFFENLKSRKKIYREQFESIKKADSIDDIISIHKNITKDIEHLDKVFNAIRTNPEGKALYYLAMKRFIVKYLKIMYQKMDLKLNNFETDKLDKKQIKEIIHILQRSKNYTQFKLYSNFKE